MGIMLEYSWPIIYQSVVVNVFRVCSKVLEHNSASKFLVWQEQMDIISRLCDDRYSILIEGGDGNALLAFHTQSKYTADIVDVRRQDHPEV